MSLKETCLLAGAICAAGIQTNKPDTAAVDPENTSEGGTAETWEIYRRTQSLAVGFANALDPKNAKHWEWPAGFEELDKAGGAGQGPLVLALKELIERLKSEVKPVPPPVSPTEPFPGAPAVAPR